jgi:hypothetical protein
MTANCKTCEHYRTYYYVSSLESACTLGKFDEVDGHACSYYEEKLKNGEKG